MAMSKLLGNDITLNEYFSILTVWFKWLTLNEPLILEKLDELKPSDQNKRNKIDFIKADVEQAAFERLSFNLTNIPVLTINNKFEALGALYVLEGSTLGSQIIIKRLRSKLSDNIHHYFYSGYGEQTQIMWREFIKHLNACCTKNEDIEHAVHGAIKTFDSLSKAFNLTLFKN